ncbi:hypothetical protein PAMA_005235 [Pampus argenteus]
MFIWEPHGCRPSLHGDGSRLLHLEQLNDSGMWMTLFACSTRFTHTHTHTHLLFHATLPGQDNIKGHRRCDGKRGISPLTLGYNKGKHFTSELCQCKNGVNPTIIMKVTQIQMLEGKWSNKSLPGCSLCPPATYPHIALLGKAIRPDE